MIQTVGYTGWSLAEATEAMQQRVRNRQETANKRFKDWAALQQLFRHDILLHGDVFRLAVIVTQIKIDSGEKLFQCGYKDPPYGNNDSYDPRDGNNNSVKSLEDLVADGRFQRQMM